MPELRTVLVLAVGLTIVACGSPDAPPAAAPAAPKEAEAPAATRAQVPRKGHFALVLRHGSLTLRSHGAPLEAVLNSLAAAAGARLELGRLPARAVTLELDDVEIGRALGLLMAGAPYEASFEPDPSSGIHTLVSLRAGRLPAAEGEVARSEPAAPRKRAGLREALLAPLRSSPEPGDPEEREGEEIRRDALARLDDPDPEQRARAVSFLRPHGEGLLQLRDLAVSDPQGRVRAAAVSQLGEGRSFGAIEGLVEALRDPEPEVVLEAIDELAFQDDATLVAHLRPLVGHSDRRIAEAAGEAIEFLEF